MTDDASDDGKWLTYQQLAEVRRISKPSAIRLVMRHRWRRQRDNERVVRVLVPPDMLEPDRAPHDAPHNVSDDVPDDASDDRMTGLMQEVLDALRATIGRVEMQADLAEARTAAAEARADAEQQRANDLRDRLIGMQEQLADAHAALQAAEAADARAKQAETGRAEERGRADRAEAATTAERARADALRERIEVLQVQLTARQEVIDDAEALQREREERQAMGRWARLRAAWRGR